MATPKIIPYEVQLRSAKIKRNITRPVVYTNDLRSAEFQFQIIDMQPGELAGATATTLLYMRDGSFFQNPKEDVILAGTTFSYLLKENEGNHAGVSQIQLVVKIGDAEFASQLFDFEVINGLDSKVAQEIMIHDWTTLKREARAYIDEFVANEILREAEFDNNEFDRNTAFVASQDARTLAFGTEQTNRVTAFANEQNERTTAFNESESDRTTAETGRVTAESNRVTAESGRVTKESQRVTAESSRVTAESGRVTAESGRVTAENARVTAETNRAAAFTAFNTRLTAEETATAANKISAVKSKTFADVDARFEDIEFDTAMMGNNGVSNGNFSNGTTGWTPWAGTLSAANNILSLANDGTNQSASVAQNTSLLLTNGNKYYVRVNARVRSTLANKLELLTYGSSPIVTIASIASVTNPIGDQWYSLSGICTPTTQAVNLRLFLQHQYADAATSLNKVMELQNALAIDLTATFGKGNEPTAEQMDGIMAKFTNSWFDGTKNLFQAKASLSKLMALDARTEFEAKTLVPNGDFSKGITGWTPDPLFSTGVVANNTLSLTALTTGWNLVRCYTGLKHTSGNKLYIRARLRNAAASSVNIRKGNTSELLVTISASANVWYPISGIWDTTGVSGEIVIRLDKYGETVVGDVLDIQYVSVIDLTATFGAGKEPTIAEMDRLMARFPNSWFDGVRPIQTIETLYQEKANKVQEAWITPTLLNGVTSVGGVPIQYMKDEFGFVTLKGWAVVAANGTTMLTLPVGYRPSISKRFPSINAVSSGSIRVNSDGSVIFESGNTSSTPLDSIRFKEGS